MYCSITEVRCMNDIKVRAYVFYNVKCIMYSIVYSYKPSV